MINFGNVQYAVYIIIPAVLAIVFLTIYALWRRRAVSLILGNKYKKNPMLMGNYKRIFLKEILTGIAVAAAAVALLRPMWGEEVKEVEYEGTDVVIALDVSRSMKAEDVNPDRLTRGREAVRRIAESLKGDRIGLIVFAGDAFLMCPLTSDISSFMMFLDAADTDSIRVQGTNIPAVLKEGERVFTRKRLTSKMLIVITDGENHEKGTEEALKFYRDNDISVYTAAIGEGGGYIPVYNGSTAGALMRDQSGNLVKSIPDRNFLKSISSDTGGHFIDISKNFSGLRHIYSEIARQQKQVFGQGIVKEKKDRTWIFLLILFLILSAEFFTGERKKL
jgi:Ca-activated chloride channel family protein